MVNLRIPPFKIVYISHPEDLPWIYYSIKFAYYIYSFSDIFILNKYSIHLKREKVNKQEYAAELPIPAPIGISEFILIYILYLLFNYLNEC